MSNEEMAELMTQAVEMYLYDEDERNVSGSGYDGKLCTERKYELIGSFGGQRFDLDLDTAYGWRTAGEQPMPKGRIWRQNLERSIRGRE